MRGNVDHGAWANTLPITDALEIEGVCLYLIHILEDLDVDPVAAGFQAVITGHSHRPASERRDGVLYLNPGSAGPRRFKLPVSLARLTVHGADITHELLDLE